MGKEKHFLHDSRLLHTCPTHSTTAQKAQQGSKERQSITRQDGTEQNRTYQNMTGQSRTGQCRELTGGRGQLEGVHVVDLTVGRHEGVRGAEVVLASVLRRATGSGAGGRADTAVLLQIGVGSHGQSPDERVVHGSRVVRVGGHDRGHEQVSGGDVVYEVVFTDIWLRKDWHRACTDCRTVGDNISTVCFIFRKRTTAVGTSPDSLHGTINVGCLYQEKTAHSVTQSSML
jgi:hypothetical protein